MTREEEIRKAASSYIQSDAVAPEEMYLAFGDFINGAKWADEHPKKGLVGIDRVCEWIRGFMEYSPLFEYQCSEEEIKETISKFRKAMEE